MTVEMRNVGMAPSRYLGKSARFMSRELAIGVDLSSAGFRVNIYDSESLIEPWPLSSLGKRGLPIIPAGIRKERLTTDFADWQLVDPGEYARYFDLSPPQVAHQVYEFRHDERRYLVPALALMRAFFRPVNSVLPLMFKANGLELAFAPRVEDESVTSGFFQTARTYPSSNAIRTSILEPLAWMCCFPSAKLMTTSVHEFAILNTIGVRLPHGKATLIASYDANWKANHVVDVNLKEIETDEEPFDFASRQSRTVRFNQAKTGYEKRIELMGSDWSVPVRPDGRLDLTDQEWEAIKGLVIAPNQSYQHDRRHLIDAMVFKYSTACTWEETCSEFARRNGVTWGRNQVVPTFNYLNRTKVWPEVVGMLRNMRAGIEVNV